MKEDIQPKQIHNLIVKLFGKSKTKSGYCFIQTTLSRDTRLEGMKQETLRKIYDCLSARCESQICPVHSELHKNKSKGFLIRPHA